MFDERADRNKNVYEFLEMIIQEYRENKSLSDAQRTRLGNYLNHFINFCKERKIRFQFEVDSNTAIQYRNKRLSDKGLWKNTTTSPKTVKDELMFLKNSVFERALDDDLIEKNPFKHGLKGLKVYKKPREPFTEDEVKTIFKNTYDETYRLFYKLLYYTGSRAGEIKALKWENIDFDKNIIHIKSTATHQTKTRKNRLVPIHHELKSELLKSRQLGEFTFPKPSRITDKSYMKKIRDYFNVKVRDKLNIDKYKSFHSFWYAFAPHLKAKGVGIEVIQELLDHSNIQITRHYQRIDFSVLEREINKL